MRALFLKKGCGAGERTRTVDQWVNSFSPRKKSLPLVHCSTELSYAGVEQRTVELNNIVTGLQMSPFAGEAKDLQRYSVRDQEFI